jgi:hypothetical protein
MISNGGDGISECSYNSVILESEALAATVLIAAAVPMLALRNHQYNASSTTAATFISVVLNGTQSAALPYIARHSTLHNNCSAKCTLAVLACINHTVVQ